jgi:hypothetical protein
VEDPDLLLSWGVGSLRRAPEHGGVILGLKIPYDVWTYSVEGRPLNHIQVPLGREYTADDVWTVERTGHGRVSRRLSSRPVPIPAGAGRIVGGAMLSQRSVQSTGERYWDILDTTGRILQSEAVPSDWIYPSAVADDGATLVVIGEKGGDPAVIVVRVRQVISDRRDEL